MASQNRRSTDQKEVSFVCILKIYYGLRNLESLQYWELKCSFWPVVACRSQLTVRWTLLIGIALLLACCVLLYNAGQLCFDHVGLGLDALLLPVHQVQQHRRYDGCSDVSLISVAAYSRKPAAGTFDSPS